MRKFVVTIDDGVGNHFDKDWFEQRIYDMMVEDCDMDTEDCFVEVNEIG